uniref:Sporulation related domain-containing protein n=1 Tax=Candidatus Kentrum sp. SD TaxID=2126332 RepID=A0A451BK42_9GAMM|nr:MAG: Sporulation related domain-containing protein [Candidatus Kentron sp. SD]
MARDYKYAGKTSSSPSRRSGSPGWVWFLAGLLIGLFITALTYLGMRHSANDALQQAQAEFLRQSQSPPSQARKKSSDSTAKADKSTKPEKKRPEPRFEFYTILPEREVRVPEHEIHSRQSKKPKKAEPPDQAEKQAPTHASGRYILQVGSFRHLEDADRLKAKLAMGGFDVEIQTVSMNNGDRWHRVRLGPYKDLGKIYRIRSGLQKKGFTPLVLKEKD